LEIRLRLFEANPNNAQVVHGLAISLNKQGDFYLSRGESGDAQQALETYQQSLFFFQHLYEINPNDAQVVRGLAVSLNKQGDFYLSRRESGDAQQALEAYQRSLDFFQNLYKANPNDVQIVQDLAFSHGKLAVFARQQGWREDTLLHYRHCAVLLESLDGVNNQFVHKALHYARQIITQIELET
jgi:tetratricopeptide (TPR) repeat protein